jgi:hypothetical protein
MYEHDYLEISIQILNKETENQPESIVNISSIKKLYISNIKFSNLSREIEREEIWKISSMESINVIYKFQRILRKNESPKKIISNIFINGKIEHKPVEKYELNPEKINEPSQQEGEIKSCLMKPQQPPKYPKKNNSLFGKISQVKFSEENENILVNKNSKVSELNQNSKNGNVSNNSNNSLSKDNLIQLEWEEYKFKHDSSIISTISTYINNFNDSTRGNSAEANSIPSNKMLYKPAIQCKDTFCEAFFVAGLPKKGAKIIPNSEFLKSMCTHQTCSLLQSYKPEILNSFVKNEKSLPNSQIFELHSATSNLCFPKGIKICYNQNESEINPNSSFLTVTTNEDGKRYYILSYHYYVKIHLHHFKNIYDFDPVTDHNKFNKEVQTLIARLTEDNLSKRDYSKFEKKYAENHELCVDLVSRDFLYLPQAICLVSKFPYSKQMKKSLEMLMKLCYDEKMSQLDMNKLIMHLIYEVPIPPNNKLLQFYLPYSQNPVKIEGKLYKDLPSIGTNLILLFNFFSSEMIVLIQNLLMMESRILFVYDDYSTLCEVSNAFISLIYPISWVNTYIPILSEEMLKYLRSFMPFIMGCDKDLLSFFLKYDEFDKDSPVFVVFLQSNRKSYIETSLRKKLSPKNVYKLCPEMPEETTKFAAESLEETLSISLNEKVPEEKLTKRVRSFFVKSMVMLFGDYKKYVSTIDDSQIFNSESFVASREQKYRHYYSEMTSTGIFRSFLNAKSEFPYFDRMCIRYINSVLRDNSKKINRISSLLNSDQKNKKNSIITSTRSSSVSKKNIEGEIEKYASSNNSNNMNISGSYSNKLSNKFDSVSSSISSSVSPPKKQQGKANTPAPTRGTINLIGSNSIEGYSDSHSFNNDKSIEQIEIFSVAPYFLNNSIKSVISHEEVVSEKYKFALNNDEIISACEKKNFTVEKIKEFNFDKMPETYKNYIIPGGENHAQQLNSSDKRISFEFISPFDETEAKSMENTKETINDFLKNIISTEYHSKVDIPSIMTLLNTKFGKCHFCRVLFQSKFLENKSQILNDKGFDDLYHIIFNLLYLCENDPSCYEEVRKVTKSSFYYYK